MSEQPTLTRVARLDSLPITKAEYTKEGYLIDTPILTSVGIFEYKNEDGSIRRELRLPEHVFAPESLNSYEGKPIIVTHDAGYVNKNNVEEESIGTILSKGFRDGDDVRAKIVVHDTDELKRSGLKELSLGYSLDLVEEPGEWNGQPYDAVQTNIIINHLALVANARAGEQARLNIDGKESKSNKGGNTTMATKKKSRRDEDDLAVELAKAVLEESADPAAAADEEGADDPIQEQGSEENAQQPSEDLLASIRERKDRRDSEQENGPENLDEANEIIKQQNEDIDALLDMLDKKEGGEQEGCETNENKDEDEENADDDEESNEDDDDEEESGTSMNADSIDAIVRARTALIRIGEKYHIDGLDKMSMKNAMRKVISTASPNIRLDSEEEIKGAFKVAVATLAARKDTEYQRKQISGTRMDSHFVSESEAARERMIKKMLKGE